jgi:hypothetical protein
MTPDRRIGGLVLGLQRATRTVPGLIRIGSCVTAGDEHVHPGRGEPQEPLVLNRHLTVRAAHEGFAQTQADRQLAHAGVRGQVRDDLVQRPVQGGEPQ